MKSLSEKIDKMNEAELLELQENIEERLFKMKKHREISSLKRQIETLEGTSIQDHQTAKRLEELEDFYTNR